MYSIYVLLQAIKERNAIFFTAKRNSRKSRGTRFYENNGFFPQISRHSVETNRNRTLAKLEKHRSHFAKKNPNKTVMEMQLSYRANKDPAGDGRRGPVDDAKEKKLHKVASLNNSRQ